MLVRQRQEDAQDSLASQPGKSVSSRHARNSVSKAKTSNNNKMEF